MKKIIVIILIGILLIPGMAFAESGRIPTIYNVSLDSADTEYSQTLSPGIKKFTVQCREAEDLRIAFESGKVATATSPYFTIKSGYSYWEDNLNITTNESLTIYISPTSGSNRTAEIIVWR